jgi:RNA polymerase sigma-70 factor (ECF subfamily)
MNPRHASATYLSAGDDDPHLVERMREGDDQALGRFYDRWSRAVYALVSQLLRDPDDADDVLEETFYQAWRHAGRYDPSRGAVSTWLLTIARTRALDRIRTRQRLREEPLTPGHDAEDMAERAGRTAVADPSAGPEDQERRERILAALGTLPPEQRQVVELAYFAGLTQLEIAERTGQPLGTVKTRVRLAGQKLREKLGEYYRGREAR